MSLLRPDGLPTNLEGYWKLDEASGNRADSSVNGNTLTDNATVSNVAYDYWSTGENSADFETGNSEYLSITDASQTGLDITSDLSIAGFVRPESVGAARAILTKWNTTGNQRSYLLRISSGNALQLLLSNAGSATDVTATSTGTVSAGKWQHFAVTFNNTDNWVVLYLDGNFDSATAYTSAIFNSTADFNLGAVVGTSEFFDGLLKDVAIWSRVLNAFEIKKLALGVDANG